MTTAYQTVDTTVADMKLGDVIQFYGARFEIVVGPKQDTMTVFRAVGKWLDGAEVPNYFDRHTTWTFQGTGVRKYKRVLLPDCVKQHGLNNACCQCAM